MSNNTTTPLSENNTNDLTVEEFGRLLVENYMMRREIVRLEQIVQSLRESHERCS